jgi:hypothetical protein
MKNKIYRLLAAVAGLVLTCGQAQALMLDSWNDTDLNASGDYIDVTFGVDSGNTWFSLQWMAGSSNELQARGIDTVFYNCEGCSTTNQKGDDTGSLGGVTNVFVGATAGTGGTDISSAWDFNFGGEEGGGGFGDFTSRKTHDGGGTDGISNVLTFLLNGIVSFTSNSNGAQFDAHVRYEEGCSGWVSDGRSTDTGSDGNCGGVPEPTPLLLLGLGLGLVGFSRWLFARRRP